MPPSISPGATPAPTRPFTTAEFAARYGLGRSMAEALLKELSAAAD